MACESDMIMNVMLHWKYIRLVMYMFASMCVYIYKVLFTEYAAHPSQPTFSGIVDLDTGSVTRDRLRPRASTSSVQYIKTF